MGVSLMDEMTRMKHIRLIDKMNENPAMSRKLGLKDRSYMRERICIRNWCPG